MMLTHFAPHTADAPSPQEMGRFVKRLEYLVRDEARTQEAQLHAQWSNTLATRVSEGKAIQDLRLAGVSPKGTLQFTCPHNFSRFREGDILCLNLGDPFASLAMMVTLEQDNGTDLVVSLAKQDVNWGLFDRITSGWVLDEGLLDLSHFYLEALREVGASQVGLTRILPLLMGFGSAQFNFAAYDEAAGWAVARGLNPTQTEAMGYAYATELAYLIQGPPGTGKTHVLAEIVRALVGQGERVLITSFTHRAINNALNKLISVAPEVATIKIGAATRADDLRAANYETFQDSPLVHESGGYAVGATPFATRTSRLSGVQFDTILFDEASQVTLPLAIMGMLKGTPSARYLFIGDHRQMPPVMVTRGPDTQIRQSVFSTLKRDVEAMDDPLSTMLTDTYRLNAPLTDWPNQMFYGGRLVSVNPAGRLQYATLPIRHGAILDPDEPKVFVDLAHRHTTTRSEEEAQAVFELVQSLLDSGIAPNEIGVVAPYRAQGRLIRARLRAAYKGTAIPDQLVVDTVERMQGQERDVVLLSLTTSSAAFATSLADFFFQPERLNVAVTRPRYKLVVVGSRYVLEADPTDADQQAAVARLRSLLQSCRTFPFPPSY